MNFIKHVITPIFLLTCSLNLNAEMEEGSHDVSQGAYVTVLDKRFAQTKVLRIPLETPVMCDNMTIVVHRCVKKVDTPPLSIRSFLEVWDNSQQKSEMIFSGWLFSERPAASSFDHPRYDMWVNDCY